MNDQGRNINTMLGAINNSSNMIRKSRMKSAAHNRCLSQTVSMTAGPTYRSGYEIVSNIYESNNLIRINKAKEKIVRLKKKQNG